jgi:5S rRNA maturation endonuclease (ribonuclease M5)
MTAQEYLTSHSLDEKFVKKTLGWNWNEEIIKIPVYNADGKRIYDKIRNLKHDSSDPASPPKFVFFPSGSHPTLYCQHLIAKKTDIVLCEGEPDCANLWQRGIPAVTSTGGVAKFDDLLAEQLLGKKVTIFLDNDLAGQGHISKVAQLLSSHGIEVKIGTLPKQFKDISEYFASGATTAEFQTIRQSALSYNLWIIDQYKLTNPIIDNSEFMSQTLPQSKWLIDKVVRSAGITFFAGIGGVGKTSVVYSLVKSVTEGGKWFGQYQATQGKVLLLDKENEPIDIQTNLRALKALSPDIHHYTTAREFQFIDDSGKLTPESVYLRAYCQENKIIAVVLDSMIDFYNGDENQSSYAALNANAWLQTFPDIAVLPIAHENKPPTDGAKKSAAMRLRGSSHLFNVAQGMLSFSNIDESVPEVIKVEHAKVRGARKLKPFQIEMIIEKDPTKAGETMITGFKYLGELQEQQVKADQTKQAIVDYLSKFIDQKFTAKEIAEALAGGYSDRMIKTVLPEMRNKNLISWETGERKSFLYWYKMGQSSVNNFIEDDENFE